MLGPSARRGAAEVTHENAARLYRPLPDARSRADERPMEFIPTADAADPRPDARARSWCCWPGPFGARATTTTWPATSPTGSPTGRSCATRGSSLWEEIRPEDIIRIDLDGNVLEGRWPVPPASRSTSSCTGRAPTSTVAVHNHPRYGTIWADSPGSRRATTRARRWAGRARAGRRVRRPGQRPDSAARAVESMGTRYGPPGQPRRLRHRREHPGRPPARRCPRVAVPRAGTSDASAPGRELPEPARSFFRNSDGDGFIGFFEAMVRQELRLDPACSSRRAHGSTPRPRVPRPPAGACVYAFGGSRPVEHDGAQGEDRCGSARRQVVACVGVVGPSGPRRPSGWSVPPAPRRARPRPPRRRCPGDDGQLQLQRGRQWSRHVAGRGDRLRPGRLHLACGLAGRQPPRRGGQAAPRGTSSRPKVVKGRVRQGTST